MNAVARTEGQAFKIAYQKLAPQIAHSLPSHISPERFERAAMMAVQREPDLLVKAERQSLFLAVQRAAQDGLMPDGRDGAIVLFGNKATWMPMVAGLMKLARNSGEIASINAHVAYRGERFSVVLGDDERIEHERNLELADGAEPIAVYAVAKLKSGETVREVLTKAQVEKVRAVSRSKSSGPWVTWWDEMAKKTAIRRLSKRLPLSTDRDGDNRLQQAVERQEDAIEGTAADFSEVAQIAASASASKLDALEYDAETGEVAPENAPLETLIAAIENAANEAALRKIEADANNRALVKTLSPDEAKRAQIAVEAARRGFTGARDHDPMDDVARGLGAEMQRAG